MCPSDVFYLTKNNQVGNAIYSLIITRKWENNRVEILPIYVAKLQEWQANWYSKGIYK